MSLRDRWTRFWIDFDADPALRGLVFCVVLLGLLLIVSVRTGHCQDAPKASTAFRLTAASMAGLAAVDVAQTTRCIHAGRCQEANPLFRSHAGSAWVLGAAKAGAVAWTWTLASSLRKHGHPRLGWTVVLSMTAIQGAVVTSNAVQLRRTGR